MSGQVATLRDVLDKGVVETGSVDAAEVTKARVPFHVLTVTRILLIAEAMPRSRAGVAK